MFLAFDLVVKRYTHFYPTFDSSVIPVVFCKQSE